MQARQTAFASQCQHWTLANPAQSHAADELRLRNAGELDVQQKRGGRSGCALDSIHGMQCTCVHTIVADIQVLDIQTKCTLPHMHPAQRAGSHGN